MATIGRRTLLKASALAAAAAATSACAVNGGSAPSGQATGSAGGGSGNGPGQLTFTTWASAAEKKSFTAIADGFKAKTGITVKVEVLPYDQIRTVIDRRLQAKQAPDLFRVSYTDVTGYAQTGALADLGDRLGTDYGSAFFPALWQAVLHDGSPVGVPHHTDCSALVFNKKHFAAAGVTDVPDTLDQAWTWDEFVTVLRKLKKAGTAPSPFAFNYQAFGAYRWFNTLFQNGGTVLSDGATSATLDSDASKQSLEWTRRLYTDGLHAPSILVKRPTYPDGIFPTGQLSMIQAGDFLIPSMQDAIGSKFEWGATYLPRNKAAATDLGGNAVVATADSKNLDAAAEFLKYLTDKQQMKAFCESTVVLPVRNDLAKEQLEYAVRPDLVPVFQHQATAMPDALVKTTTAPAFPAINQALVDNLDQFFSTPTAPVDATAAALNAAVGKALKG